MGMPAELIMAVPLAHSFSCGCGAIFLGRTCRMSPTMALALKLEDAHALISRLWLDLSALQYDLLFDFIMTYLFF